MQETEVRWCHVSNVEEEWHWLSHTVGFRILFCINAQRRITWFLIKSTHTF